MYVVHNVSLGKKLTFDCLHNAQLYCEMYLGIYKTVLLDDGIVYCEYEI